MQAHLELVRIFNSASSFNKFWNTKDYQNVPNINGVYSRDNSPKMKDGTYETNLDEYISIGAKWIALSVNGNNRRASYDTIFFDNFRVEHIQKQIKKFIGNKNIITNIYRIVDTFVLDLLTFCYKVKVFFVTQIYFRRMIMSRIIK